VVSLVTRPSLVLAWTLFQLPVAIIPVGVVWAVLNFGPPQALQPSPILLFVGFAVLIAFAWGLQAWFIMVRASAIRAVLDPKPGSAWALRWGPAETAMMMMRFSRSGPAPWLESFLAILVAAGSVALALAYHAAWPLTVIVCLAAVIWIRVRSSLTYPLIVDRNTSNWLDARREGFTLTGRHFPALCLMETITFTSWLALTALIGFAVVTGFGLAALANSGLAALEHESALRVPDISAFNQWGLVLIGALGVWSAVINALHMVICTIPTVNAYRALRPEAEADARAA
jgi:hypothetical protein